MAQWWMGAIVVLLAGTLGYYIRHVIGKYYGSAAERDVELKLADAARKAENLLKEAEIQAKTEALKARDAFEDQYKSRKKEIEALEERLAQKELNVERKASMVEKKHQLADSKLTDLEKKEGEITAKRADLDALIKTESDKLQRIAGMTQDEAKRSLIERVTEEIKGETGMMIRRACENAKETAERDAKKTVALAVQKYAFGHVSEIMTSSVALTSDEMKGRIIGRDGRNIRAIEAATGVDLLVDDTPEAVVISCFDPYRREIARQALERLVVDGRIHPGRIEEVVEKVKQDMEETLRAAGEEAVFAVGIQGIDPDLTRTLGRLKYRNSFSQNVLMHSVEVAHLMGVMAAELGLEVAIAKRIGLLHDVGKAMDSEVEGNHSIIGADFLRKHNESAVVLNAVASHHNDVEPESIYAVLAAAADAISAARPGARSETSQIYIKRIDQIEAIADGFKGVEKSFALQAGREVRVIVQPDRIDDAGAMHLARDISKKIEQDIQYPGQIKVVVIREKRYVEYAK